MKIQRLTAAVIAAAALLLSGCTSLSLNSSEILAPPRAAGSRAELQKMIEQDAGGSYTLLYPSSGEYKSGVINHDFDGDGSEEAVALYTSSDGEAKVLIAAAKGDSYRLVGSCGLSSANISSVSFADTDASGVEELIIGCDTGSPVAVLSVFTLGEEISKADIAEGISGYITGDFDGNSASDILYFTPASVESTAKAVLTIYSDGAFTEKSSCETDPSVAAYARLSFGDAGGGISGAFADGVNENGEYTTQFIYYDPASHSLINPLLVYAGYDKTVRTQKIFSADADGSGVIEIPVCTLTEHGKDEDLSTVCTAVQWCRIDTKQMALDPVSGAVLCDKMGVMLNLPTDTLSSVTARCADRSSMTVYSIDHEQKTAAGQPLITVRYYDNGEFDSEVIAEAVIYESGTGVYTCTLSDDSGFDYDSVKNSFMLTEDI